MLTYLKTFFSYKGRIARKEYFLICLSIGIIYKFFYSGITFVFEISEQEIPHIFWILHYVFFSVIYFCPTAKRLHDIEFSAWMYVLIFFVGVLGYYKNPVLIESLNALDWILSIIFIFLSCFLIFKKGTKGPNKYGPNPLELKRSQKTLRAFLFTILLFMLFICIVVLEYRKELQSSVSIQDFPEYKAMIATPEYKAVKIAEEGYKATIEYKNYTLIQEEVDKLMEQRKTAEEAYQATSEYKNYKSLQKAYKVTSEYQAYRKNSKEYKKYDNLLQKIPEAKAYIKATEALKTTSEYTANSKWFQNYIISAFDDLSSISSLQDSHDDLLLKYKVAKKSQQDAFETKELQMARIATTRLILEISRVRLKSLKNFQKTPEHKAWIEALSDLQKTPEYRTYRDLKNKQKTAIDNYQATSEYQDYRKSWSTVKKTKEYQAYNIMHDKVSDTFEKKDKAEEAYKLTSEYKTYEVAEKALQKTPQAIALGKMFKIEIKKPIPTIEVSETEPFSLDLRKHVQLTFSKKDKDQKEKLKKE